MSFNNILLRRILVSFILLNHCLILPILASDEETCYREHIFSRPDSSIETTELPIETSVYLLSFIQEPGLLAMRGVNKKTREIVSDEYIREIYSKNCLRINYCQKAKGNNKERNKEKEERFWQELATKTIPLYIENNLHAVSKLGLLRHSKSDKEPFSPNHNSDQVINFARYRMRTILLRNNQKKIDYIKGCIKYLKLWQQFKIDTPLINKKCFDKEERLIEGLLNNEKASLELREKLSLNLSEEENFLYVKFFCYGNRKEEATRLLLSSGDLEGLDPKIQFFAYKHDLIYKRETQWQRYKNLLVLTKDNKKGNERVKHKAEFLVGKLLSILNKGERSNNSSGISQILHGQQILEIGGNAIVYTRYGDLECRPGSNSTITAPFFLIKGNINLEENSELHIKAGFVNVEGNINFSSNSKLIMNAGLIRALNQFHTAEISRTENLERGALIIKLTDLLFEKISRIPERGKLIINGNDRDFNNEILKQSFTPWDWYEKSAQRGYKKAQYKVGKLYLKGQAASAQIHDPEQAFGWLTQAAYQGYAKAQTLVGLLYYLGYGIPQVHWQTTDTDDWACFWWKQASIQGNVRAKCYLSCMYRKGYGIKPEMDQILESYPYSAVKDLCYALDLNQKASMTEQRRNQSQQLADQISELLNIDPKAKCITFKTASWDQIKPYLDYLMQETVKEVPYEKRKFRYKVQGITFFNYVEWQTDHIASHKYPVSISGRNKGSEDAKSEKGFAESYFMELRIKNYAHKEIEARESFAYHFHGGWLDKSRVNPLTFYNLMVRFNLRKEDFKKGKYGYQDKILVKPIMLQGATLPSCFEEVKKTVSSTLKKVKQPYVTFVFELNSKASFTLNELYTYDNNNLSRWFFKEFGHPATIIEPQENRIYLCLINEKRTILDLRKMAYKEAFEQVVDFIEERYNNFDSECKIITGRGKHVNSNGSKGVLHKSFGRWAKRPELKPLIKKYIPYGDGGYKVLLHKPQKLVLKGNSEEQHIKRIISSVLETDREGQNRLIITHQRKQPSSYFDILLAKFVPHLCLLPQFLGTLPPKTKENALYLTWFHEEEDYLAENEEGTASQ